MKKGLICIIVFAALLFVSTFTVSADDWPPPTSFVVTSKDRSKAFHFDLDDENLSNTVTAAVYYTTDPPELVYTVEGIRSWAYLSDFYFSDDLQYFVFIPPTTNSIALEFYGNGKLTKSYTINDLVWNMLAVEHTTSTAHWREWEYNTGKTTQLDSEHNTLTLTTIDNLTYTFDITTGAVLQRINEKPFMEIMQYFALAILIVMIIGYVVVLRYKRKRS